MSTRSAQYRDSVRRCASALIATENVRTVFVMEYYIAAEAEGDAFDSRKFSKDIRASVGNKVATDTMYSRVNDGKRVYAAYRKGNASARRVYEGTLTVGAFFRKLQQGQSREHGNSKQNAATFVKRVKRELKRTTMSRKAKHAVLAALALVVRSVRVAQ